MIIYYYDYYYDSPFSTHPSCSFFLCTNTDLMRRTDSLVETSTSTRQQLRKRKAAMETTAGANAAGDMTHPPTSSPLCQPHNTTYLGVAVGLVWLPLVMYPLYCTLSPCYL